MVSEKRAIRRKLRVIERSPIWLVVSFSLMQTGFRDMPTISVSFTICTCDPRCPRASNYFVSAKPSVPWSSNVASDIFQPISVSTNTYMPFQLSKTSPETIARKTRADHYDIGLNRFNFELFGVVLDLQADA